MSKIHRLESTFIGEAICACNRRIDNHRATMDDFHARISTQGWYHDLSDQEDNEDNRSSTRDAIANADNQSGVENRPLGRRRTRGQAPQRRFQRTMPGPPPPPTQGSEEPTACTPEVIQQAMQRLFAAYNQCVARVASADDRLEHLGQQSVEMHLTLRCVCNDTAKISSIKDTVWNKSDAHCSMKCK